MHQTSPSVSKFEMRAIATGVMFMAFFGTMWAGTGVAGLKGWGSTFVTISAVLVGIALVFGGMSLIRASKRLSDQASGAYTRSSRRISVWFNTIFIAEGVLIGLAIYICNVTDHSYLIPPVIAIIVGVHFFPLAPLFHVKFYYVTGGLLCLLAVVTMLVAPVEATLAGHPIIASWLVVGFGSSLILWITGLTILLSGRKALTS